MVFEKLKKNRTTKIKKLIFKLKTKYPELTVENHRGVGTNITIAGLTFADNVRRCMKLKI